MSTVQTDGVRGDCAGRGCPSFPGPEEDGHLALLSGQEPASKEVAGGPSVSPHPGRRLGRWSRTVHVWRELWEGSPALQPPPQLLGHSQAPGPRLLWSLDQEEACRSRGTVGSGTTDDLQRVHLFSGGPPPHLVLVQQQPRGGRLPLQPVSGLLGVLLGSWEPVPLLPPGDSVGTHYLPPHPPPPPPLSCRGGPGRVSGGGAQPDSSVNACGQGLERDPSPPSPPGKGGEMHCAPRISQKSI